MRIKTRRGIVWQNRNPILGDGEPGYNSTNNRLKIGDGKTPWNELSYVSPGAGSSAPSLLIYNFTISMASVPESHTFFPDLIASDSEPLGTLDDPTWDVEYSWAGQENSPSCALLSAGLFAVAFVVGGGSGSTVAPTDGTTSFTFASMVGSSNVLGQPVGKLFINSGSGSVRGLLYNETERLFGVEVDVEDGENWTIDGRLAITKLAS